ncbi:hypothetical protein BH20ACT9_BH20ACT9_02630 [soil metagenome]
MSLIDQLSEAVDRLDDPRGPGAAGVERAAAIVAHVRDRLREIASAEDTGPDEDSHEARAQRHAVDEAMRLPGQQAPRGPGGTEEL